ncbi:MAG: hypothetical protein AWU57_292 [Marinobacter sp. T13-3]|nr:MAG: hypothetical protein AWU57_292 [Marinobacter sp. T13-3]
MVARLVLMTFVITVIVIGAIIVLDAPGDEGVDAFEGALEEYKAEPSKDTASELTSAMPLYYELTDNEFWGSREDQEKRLSHFQTLFSEAQLALAMNSHWEAMADLDNPFVFGGLTNEAKELLRARYTGNNPELLDIIGRQALESGELHEAYSVWAKAGLIDRDMAAQVRGLAVQYGCTDLDRIWGELSKERFGVGGDPLPPNDGQLSAHELTEARMALRKGTLPAIPDQCPIKPGAQS